MLVPSRRRRFVNMMETLEKRNLFSTSAYAVTSLVYNGTPPAGSAPTPTRVDSTLQDTWGMAMGPNGITVTDNHTGYIVRYRSTGASYGAHAVVPSESGGPGAAAGLLYNPTTAYDLPGTSSPATYITGTEGGNLVGWNPSTSTRVTTTLFNSGGAAEYEAVGIGAAKVRGHNHNYLYATNFLDKSVDVFNSSFSPTHVTGTFTDPNVPSNYAPYGLLVSGSNVFVTYCQLETSGDEDHPGKGLGIVDEFSTGGVFEKRIISVGGPLNDPYGMAIAPASFGTFSNDLLVSDFGDGAITAVSLKTDAVVGQLKTANRHTLSVNGSFGLWGIAFGNGAGGTNPNALYFSGPTSNESGGLIGYVSVSGTVKAAATPAFSTTAISAAVKTKHEAFSDLETIVDS